MGMGQDSTPRPILFPITIIEHYRTETIYTLEIIWQNVYSLRSSLGNLLNYQENCSCIFLFLFFASLKSGSPIWAPFLWRSVDMWFAVFAILLGILKVFFDYHKIQKLRVGQFKVELYDLCSTTIYIYICFTAPSQCFQVFYMCTFQRCCARFTDVVHVSEMLCTFPNSCARFTEVVHVSQKLCKFHKPPNNVCV